MKNKKTIKTAKKTAKAKQAKRGRKPATKGKAKRKTAKARPKARKAVPGAADRKRVKVLTRKLRKALKAHKAIIRLAESIGKDLRFVLAR